MRAIKPFVAAMAATLAGGTVPAQNVLVNGGFEASPPTGLGNHVGFPINPWVLGSGQTSNVVKVDGGTWYGSNGPRLDADPATSPGTAQHYLDIADGKNDFYQSFSPQCSDTVRFGGFFSTRANSAGTARVRIVQGVGTGGAVVGATNLVSLPAGNSMNDPWTPVSYAVPVTAGTTYSFVVQMDNNMNFDEGFVRYRTECDPAPPQDSAVNPCCPPWDAAKMKSMMSYQGAGGISGNYTLRFQAPATAAQNTVVNNQLNAYLAYVNAVNPAVTYLRIVFQLFDAGTGQTPVPGTQVGLYARLYTLGPDPTNTFFPTGAMTVNRWYTVRSTITLMNSQGVPIAFFPASCAVSEMHVRLQVLP
jgi:hypothetical protein